MISRWVVVVLSTPMGCHTLTGLDDFDVAGEAAAGGEGGYTTSSTSGGNGGIGGDGAGGKGGGSCVTALSDDFSGPLDGSLWNRSGQTISTASGVLSLAWTDVSLNPYATVISRAQQNLLECSIAVELKLPPVGAGTQAFMYSGVSLEDRTGIYLQDGVLHLVVREAGSHTTNMQLAFDPAAHRWWRLREHDARVFWEASKNGEAWTTLFDAPRPAAPQDFAATTVSLGGANNSGVPGETAFDNFNLPPSG